MVRGLDVFRDHFDGYQDRYTLIGGTAVFVAMNASGLQARVTKDLDIVICIETLDTEFARRVWEFVEIGGYEARQRSSGRHEFYRFDKPTDKTYPEQLELFSRLPNVIKVPEGCHLTPIPTADEVASLSAILLDDGYYEFVLEGTEDADGLSVLGAAHIIPLKARAWIDLTDRVRAGDVIPSNEIKKHRSDVIRLSQLISPASPVAVAPGIHDDLMRFVEEALPDGCSPADLKIRSMSLEDVAVLIREVYVLA